MAEKLNTLLNDAVAQGSDTKDKILGASFTVLNKDGIIYQGNAGRTRLPPSSPAFTQTSITWIASMTKLITTTCLMQLVERKQIALDDDVRPILPELAAAQILKGFTDDGAPILEDNTHPVTLRHLLTHTAGLGYDIADPDLMRWSQHVGRTSTVMNCTLDGFLTPFKFVPGAGWYYGTALDWAGQVLERKTGKTLGEYMQEYVFGPLGMEETGFVPGEVLKGGDGREERFVAVSTRDPESGVLVEGQAVFPPVPPVHSGGGGLYSTLEDYLKVVQSLLRTLAGEEGGLVSKETVEVMFTPQLDEAQRASLNMLAPFAGLAPEFPAGTKLDHGVGGVINVEDVPGKRKKGSMMWHGMCNSHWWIDRETGIAGILFANLIPFGDAHLNRLYNDLEPVVYGELLSSL